MARGIRANPMGRGVELDDLVAYGAKGLLEAATRFVERGVPFVVFARRRIRGAILDGIRTQHWFGRRADRRLRVDRVGHDWHVAIRAADQAHNDACWNGRPMVCLPSETQDVGVALADALTTLPTAQRRLVDLCYYQGKTLTRAARELGIGRPWASRLHARALARLATAMAANVSPPYRPALRMASQSRREDPRAMTSPR